MRRHLSGETARIWLALGIIWIIWGSTYLAIRFGIADIPPFLMAGTRYIASGGILFGFLRLRGAEAPTRRQWFHAAQTGFLLLVLGNGGVVWAEQWVASGIAALVLATVPLWAMLFGQIWGRRTHGLEWMGVVLGFAGIVILSIGTDLRASPMGIAALLLSAAGWAFGTVWSPRRDLPRGMMTSATQMLCAGVGLMLVSLISGERLTRVPHTGALLALGYLIVFGGLIGFSAYTYLVPRVRPALATSNSYVNPIVAVLLGALIGGEPITAAALAATGVIIVGVVLVILGRDRTSTRDVRTAPREVAQ